MRHSRHKFHAVRTTVNGISFPSKGEAGRYSQLLLLEKSGLIRDLELQPKFPLVVNGEKICTYIADFQYTTDSGLVTEDYKGVRTPIYRLKKKLMKAILGIEITEITS